MTKAIEEYSLSELVEKITEIINENPEPIQGFNAVVQFEVTDQDPSTYQYYFEDNTLKIMAGVEAEPKVTMQLNYDHFKKFLLGKLSGAMALMTGKVKVKGDITVALKIENILGKYNFKNLL
ncbi:SCP2 sterol-binding domain-containing protein [Neobacillus sp. OS1-32]|uniref:SCP2 sterol-binding domain-containing protein n=1 Tax=Neobacillus paridis TaxID=2803862 RepID=A0ABS1TVB9_9BACI|nr:SCP2 sterol-binding domain-containing protein [Neobacillus sp. OS1-32]MBL4954523.1 SCP2 sterol-binding domain-containing protein [Neobacillus paridis]WML30362.1 SCP2 sterol-binding domain-containing protein [Neobacillus sp. OS1-32]